MANYDILKSAIEAVIKTNGNNEITGALLQQSLIAMINSFGVGYQFVGIANPNTNPGTPDQNVCYFAITPGTYYNFLNTEIQDNEIGVFLWDGTWHINIVEAPKTRIGSKSGTASNTTVLRTDIQLRQGIKYRIYFKTDTQISTPSSEIGLWIYANGSYTRIKTFTPAEAYAGAFYDYTPVADCLLFVRTTQIGIEWHCDVTANVIESTHIAELYTDEKVDNQKATIGFASGTSDRTTLLNTGIILFADQTYDIYFKSDSLIPSTSTQIGLWTINIETGAITQIKSMSAAEVYSGSTYQYTPAEDCRLYVRTREIGIGWQCNVTQGVYDFFEFVSTSLQGLLKAGEQNYWNGKNVVVYGDSITAQGNGDNPTTSAFLYWAKDALKFANLYVRGVGGQKYMWNTTGWYNSDDMNGNYLDRYNYDALGNRLNTVVSPETTTEQEIANIEAKYEKEIEIHYGAFCSWDRIKAMIPSDIRETIDLIILCGGTNDFSAVEEVPGGDISIEEPEWIPNDATDPTWAADTQYYQNGDYDITTFPGAIASTIMKMRTWCPNAVVVVATPFPRFNTTTKQQYKNLSGLTFRQSCEIQMEIANFVGATVIDSNGECGIGGYNFSSYVTDGVHPNLDGRKMFGRVFIGELLRLASKIV